jgi:hypothetical protein
MVEHKCPLRSTGGDGGASTEIAEDSPLARSGPCLRAAPLFVAHSLDRGATERIGRYLKRGQ